LTDLGSAEGTSLSIAEMAMPSSKPQFSRDDADFANEEVRFNFAQVFQSGRIRWTY